MVQEMVKQQVKATKDRKHVPEHRDRDLKVVRCLYTDVFRREVSKTGINVDALNRYEDGAVVTVETMIETGLVSNPRDGVKILGNGEVTKKLTVKANAFSESAKAKIEAAGGTVEVI